MAKVATLFVEAPIESTNVQIANAIGLQIADGGGTPTIQTGIYFDSLTSGITDVGIDLNGNTLENVGASGNDWSAATFQMVADSSGSNQTILIENESADADSLAQIIIKVGGGGTSGDPMVRFRQASGTDFVAGIDVSESSRWTLGTGSAPGAADAMRVTTALATTFENQGADYDYVCEGCGKSSIEMFTCCGLVEWHDDVLALRTMRLSEQGMEHMVKLGVLEIDGPNDADPGWTGMNIQKSMNFTWAGMWQNRERMDAQNEAMDARLKRIEQALGV